jgi:hypothetical protein
MSSGRRKAALNGYITRSRCLIKKVNIINNFYNMYINKFFTPLKITVLALIIFSVPLFAQASRGKLTGKVIDDKTREPLIGANIIIEGTTLGAAADINGRYIILNVPAGSYTVTASLLGYGKVRKTEVEIDIDRTTELNFNLKDASVQLEQVTIVAERHKIIKDQTSTATTLSESQIKAAPIEGIRGALDLSAGFQKTATGNYSVRGSGSYEVNFQINGVEQVNSSTIAPVTFGTDKANNSWKYDVNPLGVQQVQLITGGFSAEYGNAQAGVVKVALKEGTPKFTGEFRVEYRPAGQYHFGDYIYSKDSYEWKKWGSLDKWMSQQESIIKELKLDTRYKDLYDKRKNSRADSSAFYDIANREIAWAYNVWVKNHTPSDDNPLGVYDYTQYGYKRYMVGFGGPLGKDPNLLRFYFSGEYRSNPTRLPTPEKNQVYQNYIMNVSYQPVQNQKFKIMGSYQNYRGGIWSGSDDIRWSGLAFTPPGLSTKYYITTDPVRTEQTVAQSVNWVYTISPRAFVEATVSHQQEKYELPYEYLVGTVNMRDRLDSLYDPEGQVLKDGIWWDNAYFRPLINASTNYYQDTRTENISVNLDYTNQIVETNLLKAGLRFYYWDMLNNACNSSFSANTFLTRSGYADYYHAYPFNAAFYVQDKMEYSGMIANIGVRGEAYNFNSLVPVDEFNIFYQGKGGPSGSNIGNPATTGSATKFILLPRIGISFPIGENTAFRIQYGHFASMPTFSQALSRRTQSGWTGIGNPDLDPKKTINYEFGLQQVLGQNHRFDVVLYYNDRTTQIGLQKVASYTGSSERSAGFALDNTPLFAYTTYANNAFGSTVGMEFTFETIGVGDWSYRLSYSLSQTTDGTYGASTIYPDGTRNYLNQSTTGEFLSSNDRTHNFRALLQYRVQKDAGFDLFGIKPFSNTVFSLTYSAQSGTPFTYTTVFDPVGVTNNRRYPLETSFDFNAIKNIDILGYKMIVGVRIMNLFNNQWLTPMDVSDDIINWVENGITMADPGNDPTRLSYVVAPYRAYRNIPRQIFFTLGFGLN